MVMLQSKTATSHYQAPLLRRVRVKDTEQLPAVGCLIIDLLLSDFFREKLLEIPR